MPNPPDTDKEGKNEVPEHDAVHQSWEEEVDVTEDSGVQSQLTHAVKDLSIGRSIDPTKHPSARLASHQSRHPSHPFYFYHALPNFFLSPLDIRILKSAFGDFSAFPSTILPRVEHLSTGHVVDDDLRKRAKYMAHLPQGCEVSFLECDWTDVISPVVLAHFEEEIVKRRKRNSEKEAREERDRLRAEKVEDDKKWASIRRRRPSLVEKSFSEADFQPLAHPQSIGLPSDPMIATTPPWGNHRFHSSFATLATPGTSPDAARTVWGTAAVTPLSPALTAAPEPAQPVDDGWLQGWEKDLLDEGDAVMMVEASINGESSSRAANLAPSAAKKVKKKKITLMSTNARRGA